MWDLPEPGIITASPSLAGVFWTTGPPKKSQPSLFNNTPPIQEYGVSLLPFVSSSILSPTFQSFSSIGLLPPYFQLSSIQWLSHASLFVTSWIAARQASLSITNPGTYSNSCPSSWWCHPTISSSVIPFSSSLHLAQQQSLFQWVSASHPVAKVLEFQLQHQCFQWVFRVDFL